MHTPVHTKRRTRRTGEATSLIRESSLIATFGWLALAEARVRQKYVRIFSQWCGHAPAQRPFGGGTRFSVPIGGSLRALPPIVPPCSRKHRLVRTGTLQRLALSPSSRRGQLQHPSPLPAGERHHAREPTSALRRSRRCGRWPPFFHSPRHSFSLSESLARVPTSIRA